MQIIKYLCQAMENAAMRGVDIRIITPHIPDKKIVLFHTMKQSINMNEAGVKNTLLQRAIRALVRALAPLL